jgi:energy-converting hydrogenase B subunit D
LTTAVIVTVLGLVAASGSIVALTRDPFRQTVVLGVYGLTLAVAFVVFQAPDVALSIAAVQGVALPLMILVALAKTGGGPP